MVHRGKIHIVDDTPTNLKVLCDYLLEHGFEVFVSMDGETALQQVSKQAPDLILLDVMMPGIDGFETCRRLKASSELKDIPVIFMTALSETTDKVKGFSLGAVDYVTKPIQQEEVLARVTTHLALRRLQICLEQKNRELKAAEEKYRCVFENAVVGIFQSTPEGKFLKANKAMAKILGFHSDQELTNSATNLESQMYLDSERRGQLRTALGKEGTVSNFESQVCRKDGGVIWISESVRSVQNDEGGLEYFEGFVD